MKRNRYKTGRSPDFPEAPLDLIKLAAWHDETSRYFNAYAADLFRENGAVEAAAAGVIADFHADAADLITKALPGNK